MNRFCHVSTSKCEDFLPIPPSQRIIRLRVVKGLYNCGLGCYNCGLGYTTAGWVIQLRVGLYIQVRVGLLQLRVGLLQLRVGLLQLRVGLLQLRVGLLQLRVGLLQLRVGLLQLRVGLLQLQVGFLQLRVGLLQLRVGLLQLRVGLYNCGLGCYNCGLGCYNCGLGCYNCGLGCYNCRLGYTTAGWVVTTACWVVAPFISRSFPDPIYTYFENTFGLLVQRVGIWESVSLNGSLVSLTKVRLNLGSMFRKCFVSQLYNPLILTFYQHFQRDIQGQLFLKVWVLPSAFAISCFTCPSAVFSHLQRQELLFSPTKKTQQKNSSRKT